LYKYNATFFLQKDIIPQARNNYSRKGKKNIVKMR